MAGQSPSEPLKRALSAAYRLHATLVTMSEADMRPGEECWAQLLTAAETWSRMALVNVGALGARTTPDAGLRGAVLDHLARVIGPRCMGDDAEALVDGMLAEIRWAWWNAPTPVDRERDKVAAAARNKA